MRAVIMSLDLFHIDRLSDSRCLIDISTIVENSWGIRHTSRVCFEIDVIDFIVSQQGDKESNICLRKLITCNVSLFLKYIIHTIKGFCKFTDCQVISLLRS